MSTATLLPTGALLPAAWRALAPAGPWRAFNPGLLSDGDGFVLAYRVVLPDQQRRLALCRLDGRFGVTPGSVVPLSDLVDPGEARGQPGAAAPWLADPRLVRLGGRTLLYWNSGWHQGENAQYLLELDPATLRPRGQPRELVLRGPRRTIEKNWMFFEGPGPRAVYAVAPHRILGFTLQGEGPIAFETTDLTELDLGAYGARFGELRGGAPPQLHDGHWYCFAHSVHGPGHGAYRYAAAVYRFAAAPPHRPTGLPAAPLDLPNPLGERTEHPRLNPAVAEVVYPAGAVLRGDRWLVSYGLNDERCALAEVPHSKVLAGLLPVPAESGSIG